MFYVMKTDLILYQLLFSVQRQLNMSINSSSLLESSNILNGIKPDIVSGSKRTKFSGGGNLLGGSQELGKQKLRNATDILKRR